MPPLRVPLAVKSIKCGQRNPPPTHTVRSLNRGKGVYHDSQVSSSDEEPGFDDIVAELDREEARVKVRMEMRRFRKPTTVIEGLKMNEKDLQELGTKMKKMLATGGTVKDGIVLLQGDHRDRVVEILVKRGFSESSIEVI
jgi:translation initiation factor 1